MMAINFSHSKKPSDVVRVAREEMAKKAAYTPTATVAQQSQPNPDVAQHVARIEALEREVADLRRIITENFSSIKPNSRAEYYREYRKRQKG